MFNRLHIKLLLPTAVIGVLALLFVVLFAQDMNKGSVITLLLVLVIAQVSASFFFSTQFLSKRIENLKHYLDLVISVDQAPPEPLKDEQSDDFAGVVNELSLFIANLADVIKDIRQESDSLRQGAGFLTSQISDSVIIVDQSAEQIEQMASSIDEIASTSTTLSQGAAQVSDTSNEVLSLLQQGTSASNTSQETIAAFANEVTEMANELALLQEECSRIGSVLDVIRGIADQTNLLALNAAIEAARAGEQGRGFAVVADEVRALAHRTQESTVEIQSMVEGLQEKSTNAVNAIAKGENLTQDSLQQSEEVVEALGKIGQVFTEVNTLTSQIASGTEQQQQSTASINDNMAAVVSLSQDINKGLTIVAEHAEQQKATAEEVDTTLNRICV
ncbi:MULTISPECIES: methyl-accepting chemotaxis protein [Thalassotalea]|uniref:Methyl-accepting chemotaxis protein n=1 Tax=Thalassotalea castellviae TaxID=3075612 RepID=A0ABU3A569_9GAMM|nr:methyl-accepting chemotaxis protein [Thalassotalea sp. W431]MDT0604682.1 methyl-accepting chemotaxis protein [Thalassotalea sp. W431]